MTLQLFCRRGESAKIHNQKKQQEAAGAISIMASEKRKSFRRVRREHKIYNQRAARGCGAITIMAC